MAIISKQFLEQVRLKRDDVPSFDKYPFNLDAVRELDLARVSTMSIASADVQIRLGQAQLGRGDLDGALARFDAALTNEPENILGQRARAYTLHLLGRYEEALTAWTEALRLEPTDLDTRGNRALAAVAAGKLGVARADLDVLLQRTSPTAPVVLAVRRALDAANAGGDDAGGEGGR